MEAGPFSGQSYRVNDASISLVDFPIHLKRWSTLFDREDGVLRGIRELCLSVIPIPETPKKGGGGEPEKRPGYMSGTIRCILDWITGYVRVQGRPILASELCCTLHKSKEQIDLFKPRSTMYE